MSIPLQLLLGLFFERHVRQPFSLTRLSPIFRGTVSAGNGDTMAYGIILFGVVLSVIYDGKDEP